MINIEKVRNDFPQLSHKIQGHTIVYFDNAATTLKPLVVMEKLKQYYLEECANIHRGIHTLSELSTAQFEAVRDKVQNFIHAHKREEIIFTRGTTESTNLVARSYVENFLNQDDELLITELEHHSNIVPWQMAVQKTQTRLKAVSITEQGELDLKAFESLLNPKVKFVAMNAISNALGTINPIDQIIPLIRQKAPKAKIFIDAAQAVAHKEIDVQKLDIDFLAFSGHKLFGPTGVGVLYGKEELLNQMPPFMGGGDMIDEVTIEKTTYNALPHKFEAGTPMIAQVIALGAALDYVQELGLKNIEARESELLNYATQKLSEIPGLKILGPTSNKTSVISFVIEGLHPQDLAMMLNKYHLALRSGHHCTQPLMKKLGVTGTLRASLSFYNTEAEVDHLVESLKKIIEIFGE